MLTLFSLGFFSVSTRTAAAPTRASATAPAMVATAIADSASPPSTVLRKSDDPRTRATSPLAAVRLLTMLSLKDQVASSPEREAKSPFS